MHFTTLQQIARLVSGQLHGDPQLLIRGAAPLLEAGSDEITFIDRPNMLARIAESKAAAFLLPEEMTTITRPHIRVPRVQDAFASVVAHFRPPPPRSTAGCHATAQISDLADIDATAHIGPFAYVGDDVKIGPRCVIGPHVSVMSGCQIDEDVQIFAGAVLYENTIVGARSLIHAGAVLGAFGFGYQAREGRHVRSPQLGNVVLQADVEVGACTTIDRGTYGATLIGEGTKIDNHVMIAHNCQIGRHNLICSQVGIAGSSTTGDYVVMAGQVGVPDHIRIGHRAVLGAKAGIMRDVPDGITVVGIPATPEREQMQIQASLSRLPEMRKQLRSLQRMVEQLQAAERRGDAA